MAAQDTVTVEDNLGQPVEGIAAEDVHYSFYGTFAYSSNERNMKIRNLLMDIYRRERTEASSSGRIVKSSATHNSSSEKESSSTEDKLKNKQKHTTQESGSGQGSGKGSGSGQGSGSGALNDQTAMLSTI